MMHCSLELWQEPSHMIRITPLCFATKPSLSLKFFPAERSLARHRKRPPYHAVSVRSRATLSPTLCETVASKYRKVDVFNQQLQPCIQSDQKALNPVIIIPGYGATAKEYYPMADVLRETLGPDAYVRVVPVKLSTWLSTVGGRPITPVLRLLDDTVQKAIELSGSSQVHLVAHSAGGWIARIYLGETPYPSGSSCVWNGGRFVSKLVCLGTPHRSDEGVTRKNMQFVNENYPGAYHGHVHYVNIVGSGGSIAEQRNGAWRFWESDWFTRVSYCLTDKSIGCEAAEGDGIVPLSSAFLPGAQNICLKGIWHSPSSRGVWYGHPDAINYWSSFLQTKENV